MLSIKICNSKFTSIVMVMALIWSTTTLAASPEEAIKFRQSIFTAQQWNMQIMSRMVKGDVAYDKAEFSKRAQNLAELSSMFYEGFLIKDSDIGDTKAKPEIWTSMDKFKAGSDKLASEAAKLVSVSQGSDFKAIKAQFGDTQKSCGACHDNYRSK